MAESSTDLECLGLFALGSSLDLTFRLKSERTQIAARTDIKIKAKGVAPAEPAEELHRTEIQTTSFLFSTPQTLCQPIGTESSTGQSL